MNRGALASLVNYTIIIIIDFTLCPHRYHFMRMSPQSRVAEFRPFKGEGILVNNIYINYCYCTFSDGNSVFSILKTRSILFNCGCLRINIYSSIPNQNY